MNEEESIKVNLLKDINPVLKDLSNSISWRREGIGDVRQMTLCLEGSRGGQIGGVSLFVRTGQKKKNNHCVKNNLKKEK